MQMRFYQKLEKFNSLEGVAFRMANCHCPIKVDYHRKSCFLCSSRTALISNRSPAVTLVSVFQMYLNRRDGKLPLTILKLQRFCSRIVMLLMNELLIHLVGEFFLNKSLPVPLRTLTTDSLRRGRNFPLTALWATFEQKL